MLPLVLGGIALAAVGYGVKEFCESEGCPWDAEVSKESSKTSKNIFEKIEERKRELHEEVLSQFKEYLLATVHKKQWKFEEPTVLTYEKFSQNQIPKDVKLYAKMYLEMLEDISLDFRYISQVLKEKSKPYKNFTKEQKKLVKNAYKLFNLSYEFFALKLLDNNELNIEVIAPLKVLKNDLEVLSPREEVML